MDSPITFDDLKCTSAPSTIFRMSLASHPGKRGRRRRSSIISMSSSESEEEEDAMSILSKPPQLPEIGVLVEDAPVAEQRPRHPQEQEQDDGRSFLWDNDAADSDSDSDDSTLHEHDEFDPSPIDPFFAQPKPSPSPAPTHASSFDGTSPWFMHFDVAALSALDNQLLQSPFDAFSDLCYAQAVELEDASVGAIPGSYTWRRFSRLRPLSPFSEEDEEELRSELNLDQDADSESDTDSEQLASPEQAAVHQSWAVRPRVYSPTPASHSPHWHRHARHFQHDSDGSIHFRPQVSTISVSLRGSLVRVSYVHARRTLPSWGERCAPISRSLHVAICHLTTGICPAAFDSGLAHTSARLQSAGWARPWVGAVLSTHRV